LQGVAPPQIIQGLMPPLYLALPAPSEVVQLPQGVAPLPQGLIPPIAPPIAPPIVYRPAPPLSSYPPAISSPLLFDKQLEDFINGVLRDVPDPVEPSLEELKLLEELKGEEDLPYYSEEEEGEEKYAQSDIAPIASLPPSSLAIRPLPEEKEEEVKGPEPPPKVVIKPSKKLVTAKDIREELKNKMETLRKEIKDGLNLQIDQYSAFLKTQRELNKQDSTQGLTKEQAKTFHKQFVEDLKKSDEFKDKIKQYKLLEASLLDDDSPAGIAAKQNIQNLADARNFQIEKKGASKRGKEYFEKKLGTVKENLEEKERKYLIDDPDNPGKKKLNPDIDFGMVKMEDGSFRSPKDINLDNLNISEQEKEKADPNYDSRYRYSAWVNNDELNDFLKENNNGIDFIDKNDRYMIDTLISNAFEIKKNAPIPIIFDIRNDAKFQVAKQNIDYIINKYVKDIPDKNTRSDIVDNIISYIIKKLNKDYYIYKDDDITRLAYSEFINNLIEDRVEIINIKGPEEYQKDITTIPRITEIKNRLDQINTKNITLKDKVEVAELWNKLYNGNKEFTKIWTYMGLDKDSFYGKDRGSVIWDKIFISNPAFSKDHNLFAIGDLKEALERRERMKKESGNITSIKDIKDDFVQKNIAYFDSKGEKLTQEEALQLFTDIINSLRQKNPSPPTAGTKINTLSSTKGSGISKRRILKYLKGKSKVSKPNIKGLDTEILKILNS